MSYRLKFLPSALKEWRKLDGSIQAQLKKKVAERLIVPHVPASALSGFENHYKIKLRASGYRLVYEVIDEEVIDVVGGSVTIAVTAGVLTASYDAD